MVKVVDNLAHMYGKHFSSMYSGSMIGSGACAFAVMGYVIASQKPDPEVGMQVELNPELLGFVLGEPVEKVREVIEKLCAPDPRSRSKEEEGRRLVRLGEFDYRVVNGAHYASIRSEEERREYNREAKRRERGKSKDQTSQTPQTESNIVKRFTPPSFDETMLEASKAGLPRSEVEKFMAYYGSKGWLVGKAPMKDWRKALAGWRVRWEEAGRPGGPVAGASKMSDAEKVRAAL